MHLKLIANEFSDFNLKGKLVIIAKRLKIVFFSFLLKSIFKISVGIMHFKWHLIVEKLFIRISFK